jgi:hypothetical protein
MGQSRIVRTFLLFLGHYDPSIQSTYKIRINSYRVVHALREAADRDIADTESEDIGPAENENTAESAEEIAQAQADFAAHVALYVPICPFM